MSEHSDYVAKGYCDAIYVDDDGEHWCKLQADHEGKHVAPWRMEFPRQETMVCWNDGPVDVEWLRWEDDPAPAIAPMLW